jgi:dethiobiotin synthetase
MAGAHISLSRILYRYGRLAGRHRAVVVEGAGGVLVPLNERENMRDLMRAMGLPVVLVVRPGLGTLNHSLLSIEALRSAGLTVRGIVIVHASTDPGQAAVTDDNRRVLCRRGDVELLAVFPHAARAIGDPVEFRRVFRRQGRQLLHGLS